MPNPAATRRTGVAYLLLPLQQAEDESAVNVYRPCTFASKTRYKRLIRRYSFSHSDISSQGEIPL